LRRGQCLRRNRPAQKARHGLRLKITIESFNYQIRKIIKNRGQFPTDDAVVKLIWLAVVDIEDKRARARERDRGKPANQRNAPGRLIEGQTSQGWRQALNAFATVFEERIPQHAL
jgi:putative transposase